MTTSRVRFARTMPKPSRCSSRGRPIGTSPTGSSATATTSSTTSTSASPGMTSREPSRRTSRGMATGTSTPSSRGRSASERQPAFRRSPTHSASADTRACSTDRSAMRCPRPSGTQLRDVCERHSHRMSPLATAPSASDCGRGGHPRPPNTDRPRLGPYSSASCACPAGRSRRNRRLLRSAIGIAPSASTVSDQAAALRDLLGSAAAKRLSEVATAICHRHDGQLPEATEDLRALPRVGTHTAAMVRCFGFGQPTPLTSQGARRIVERVTGQPSSSVWTSRLQLVRLAGARGPDVAFNAALLRLAEERCLPSRPLCGACPVRPECKHGIRAQKTTGTGLQGSAHQLAHKEVA